MCLFKTLKQLGNFYQQNKTRESYHTDRNSIEGVCKLGNYRVCYSFLAPSLPKGQLD